MTHPKFTLAAAALSAAVVFGMTGCAAQPVADVAEPTDDSPFTILAMVPQSGPLAKIGVGVTSSMEAAVEVINDNDGIDGREVEIKFVDTTSSPSEAVSRLQAELSSDTPDLVVPSVVSSETIAMLPLLTQSKILSVGTAAGTSTTDPDNFPYAFNTAVQANDSMAAQVNRLKKDGIKNLAVILPDSELGNDKLAALEKLTAKAGIKMESELVDPASVDPTAELTRLQGSKADALLVAAALGPSGGSIMGAFDKIGWDIPLYMDDATSNNNYSGFSASALENVTFAAMGYGVTGSPIRDTEAYTTYWDAFTGIEATFDQGPDVYVYPYSALILAKAAIDKAGGIDDIDAVVSAFESISTEDSDLWIMTEQLSLNPDNHSIQIAVDDMEFFPAGARNNQGLFVGESE